MKKTTVLFTAFSFVTFLVFSVIHPAAEEMEPSEPEIVLPSVILEIEDLSVENVRTKLPENELVPPEIEVPLPEAGELQIEEPPLSFKLPKMGPASLSGKKGGSFIAEGVIGVGTLNHLLSSFSLFQFDKTPGGKLLFRHEVLDGFSEKPIGSGYNMREDRLSGNLKFGKKRLKAETAGEFNDVEQGLQNNGSFYSKTDRSARGSATVDYALNDSIALKGHLDTSVTTRLLSGSTEPRPEKSTEYAVTTSLQGTYTLHRGYVGFSPRYSYRNGGDQSAYLLNRVQVKGLFGYDLSDTTHLQGDISWFWSDDLEHKVPFNLSITTYPTDLFSLSAGGGYRIQEFNLSDVLDDFMFADVPGGIRDNSGWYFTVNSHLNFLQGWVAYGGLTFMNSAAMLTVQKNADPLVGLFPVSQVKMHQLTSELGIRWMPSQTFSAYVSWTSEIMDKPNFYPGNSFSLEANINNSSGKLGGIVSSAFNTGVNDFVQAPVVNIEGFYRVNDSLMFSAEVNDLLYPVLDGPRYSWYPFIDKGLGIVLKAHITF